MCCFTRCLPLFEEDEERGGLVVLLDRGVSQSHVITFAARGFVTHWLQAQGPRLASDRALPNPTLSGSQTEVL